MTLPYHLQFPICDLLISEFEPCSEIVTSPELPESVKVSSYDISGAAQKVSRVAHYIYQKVVRRKPVPFQPSDRNPKYLLCYVEEELECGHTLTIYAGDPLVARTRCCHECADWFGALPLKKSMQSVKRMIERSKEAGFGNWWALIFAGTFVGLLALIVFTNQPKIYIYQAPIDTFRVIAQDSDFNFILQQVHEGVPQKEAVYHFDPNQPMPRFQIGETLDQLIYEDKGEYQQLARGVPYIIERDLTLPGHWPKLAGNCVNLGVKQPVICDGKPQF